MKSKDNKSKGKEDLVIGAEKKIEIVMMETLTNSLDIYSNQLPPLTSASASSLGHSPGSGSGLDGSKKYAAVSLLNNNVMGYGNPAHLG